jgi:hypothetical protein
MAKPRKKRRAKAAAGPAKKRPAEKKAPARRGSSGGGRPSTPTKERKAKASKTQRGIKRKAPLKKPAAKPAPKPVSRPAKPAPKKRPGAPARPRKLSQTPEAIRARRYRKERRAIEEARQAEGEQRAAKKRAQARQRRERAQAKKQRRPEVTERDVAIGWLEEVREHAATVSPTSLSIVEPEAAAGNVWLVCGRFDLHDAVSYFGLGEIFERVLADDLLAARVNPSRLTQVRVIYEDPNAPHRAGDSIVSKIAGWEFAWGDLIAEILGGGQDDEGALAARYEATRVSIFYVYLAPTIVNYRTIRPTMKTITLPTNYQR